MFQAQQQFEPIACSDDRATAEITALGAEIGAIEEAPVDDECPPDSDLLVRARTTRAGGAFGLS